MSKTLTLEDFARVCHEANRALCMTLGDHTIGPWDVTAVYQRESSLEGATYALAHPDVTPEGMHEKWMADKLAAGWKHGEIKRPENREHPCLVPFAELPPEQQAKDALFLGVVRALLPLAPKAPEAPKVIELPAEPLPPPAAEPVEPPVVEAPKAEEHHKRKKGR